MKYRIKSLYDNTLGTGLRKVINSLTSAVKNIDNPKSVLAKLGIKKEEIVDANGSFKSMTDIMGVLQKHTDTLTKTEKGAIFNALFGTTGQQAGMILAENSVRLGELTQKTQEASEKGQYVQTLAEKNSQTAQANIEKFKMAWEELTIKFGAELLPYMTEATKSLSSLFSQKDFQEDVKSAARGIRKVSKFILNIAEFCMKYNSVIFDFAKILAKLWVVDKVINFTLKMRKLADVFGSFTSKVKKEQLEVASLAKDYLRLAEAKQTASGAYSTSTVVNKSAETAEQLAVTTTYYPNSSGKAPNYKGVGSTVSKEIEETIATSGAIEAGVAKSVDAASKGSKLASGHCNAKASPNLIPE